VTEPADLPDPPIDADVDLRGLPWMRLDVLRLMDSDLFALSTGDEFKAAVALWCKSWHQQPAGSLPTDDRVLAHLSGAGPRWAKVKEMALRGWSLASDGRLYHEVITAQVLIAWDERLDHLKKREADRERLKVWRENKRQKGELGKEGGKRRGPHGTETSGETSAVTMVKRVSTDVRNGVETSKTGRDGTGDKSFPASPGGTPPAPDAIFGFGLEFLIQHGTAENAARSWLGAMRKRTSNNDAAVLELLLACQRERVVDPIPWLRAALDKRYPNVPAGKAAAARDAKIDAAEQLAFGEQP